MFKKPTMSSCATQRPCTAAMPRGRPFHNLRYGPTAVSVQADRLTGCTSAHVGQKSNDQLLGVLAGATMSLMLTCNSAWATPQAPSLEVNMQANPAAQLPAQRMPGRVQLQQYSPAVAPVPHASTALPNQPAQHDQLRSTALGHVGLLQQEQQGRFATLQQAQLLQPQHAQYTTQQQQQNQQTTTTMTQQLSWQELQQLAQLDEPRLHWLLVVLGIGVVNILGLQAVLKLLQASRDSSTPVTVLVCRMGLRVGSSNKLQERLHFLRDMMGVEHAIFFTFEEAMQILTDPPRGCQLAYADLVAKPLGSKQAGYDLFKQQAMTEAVRAQQEEAAQVLKGTKPEAPHHRNMLEKLLGAAETQDAEEAQACLLVTLVVLAKGTVVLPQQPLQSLNAFKESMKSLCGHLKLGQLLAVELLMTPDNPQDFLSEAQLMTDYPFLTDLSCGLRIDEPGWSPAPSPYGSVDDFGASAQTAEAAAAAAMAAMAAEGAMPDQAAGAAAAAAAGALADERAS